MSDDFRQRAETATRAAKAGASVAMETFRTDLEVEYKDGRTDAVTQADRDAQDAVVEAIRETFPDDPIVGEEEGTLTDVPDAGPGWIVDPIDGTSNYVRGVQLFGTAVATVIDGEPVAGTTVFPALEDTIRSGPTGVTLNDEPITVSDVDDPTLGTIAPTFWWELDRRDEYAAACREIVERFDDMRRYGSAQATLGMVASGALDGTISNVAAYSWDTVAGVHMIREAGGTVTDLHGDRWHHDSVGIVATNGRVHDEALAAARAIEHRSESTRNE